MKCFLNFKSLGHTPSNPQGKSVVKFESLNFF